MNVNKSTHTASATYLVCHTEKKKMNSIISTNTKPNFDLHIKSKLTSLRKIKKKKCN